MHVVLIVKPGQDVTGIGRYAIALEQGLVNAGCEVSRVYPKVPIPKMITKLIKKMLGWDLASFFNNYPIMINYPQADIYHFTSQNLATLLVLRKPKGKVIVTVHDIIPVILHDDPGYKVHRNFFEEFFYKLVLRGIRHADGIIAISNHTCKTLVDHLNLPTDRIWRAYQGI